MNISEHAWESSPDRGGAASAVRRWASTALVAAAATAGMVIAAPGTAGARPLPGDDRGPDCRVDVRASTVVPEINAVGVHVPRMVHVFVIYSEHGREQYFRGGPKYAGPSGSDSSVSRSSPSRSSSSAAGAGSKSSPSSDPEGRLLYGPLVTQYGAYKPGTPDYEPSAPSVTVAYGTRACGKQRCFAAQARRINQLGKTYNPFGPNSNSVARTILARCDVHADKPDGAAPGWDEIL